MTYGNRLILRNRCLFGVCSFHVGKIVLQNGGYNMLSTKMRGNILICQLHTSFSPIHLVFNSWQVRKSPWRWSILGGVQLPSCTPSHASTPPPPHRGWVTELSPNRGASFKNDGSKQIPAEFGVFFFGRAGSHKNSSWGRWLGGWHHMFFSNGAFKNELLPLWIWFQTQTMQWLLVKNRFVSLQNKTWKAYSIRWLWCWLVYGIMFWKIGFGGTPIFGNTHIGVITHWS